LGKLYGIKSNNALLYILAGVHRMQNNLDECIILNQNFSITEAISYNIFAVKNRVLYTPPLDEGCLDGIMRQHIIEISKQNRIAVYEVPLAMNVLLNSDEIFLTNVINGIRWVGAYKAKRYFNTIACLLNEKLNESLEK
jgi:branched-chain amino acid aminotransferase